MCLAQLVIGSCAMSNKEKKRRLEEERAEKKQREDCIVYKAVDSPSKIPKCKEGQLIAFDNDQIDALRTKSATIKGKIAIIYVDRINRCTSQLFGIHYTNNNL